MLLRELRHIQSAMHYSIIAAIILLFLNGNPSAVVLGVPEMTLSAIKRQLRAEGRPHVTKKDKEIIPCGANSDTAIKIETPVRISLATSPAHGLPSAIYRGASVAVGGQAAPLVYFDAQSGSLRVSLHTNSPFVFGLGLARSVQLHAGPSFYPAASAQSTRFA